MPTNSDLDTRIVQALEATPRVHIPEDFATRVLSRVPHPREARVGSTTAYGLWTIRLSLAILLVVICIVSPAHSTPAIALELLLTAEFVALATWTTLRPA